MKFRLYRYEYDTRRGEGDDVHVQKTTIVYDDEITAMEQCNVLNEANQKNVGSPTWIKFGFEEEDDYY